MSIAADIPKKKEMPNIMKLRFPVISLNKNTDHIATIRPGPTDDIGKAMTIPKFWLAIKLQV